MLLKKQSQYYNNICKVELSPYPLCSSTARENMTPKRTKKDPQIYWYRNKGGQKKYRIDVNITNNGIRKRVIRTGFSNEQEAPETKLILLGMYTPKVVSDSQSSITLGQYWQKYRKRQILSNSWKNGNIKWYTQLA